MELGFNTGELHEKLEERQPPVLSSTSPVRENAYSRVQSVHGVIEHHISAQPASDNPNTTKMGTISEHEEDIGTQREAMNSLDWIEEVHSNHTREYCSNFTNSTIYNFTEEEKLYTSFLASQRTNIRPARVIATS